MSTETNATIRTKVIKSESYDSWFNLAVEEYLLNSIPAHTIILYLWQNDNTVVIGRNQNAWKECDWESLENAGGKLARRLSGGGAVYHDLGNLNFTFLVSKDLYDLEKQLGVILQALAKLQIEAAFSGRNDLVLQGKKFSGHAYYFGQRSALHHGTILVNLDLEKLVRYLSPSPKKIISKGIESVRSRVINLADVNGDIVVPQVIESLVQSFAASYTIPEDYITISESNLGIGEDNLKAFDKIYKKYSSWEWRFGKSPSFDISFTERFTWGEIEIGFKLKNGLIHACMIFSDAMDEELIRKIAAELDGLPLNKQELIHAVSTFKSSNHDNLIIHDLTQWMRELHI